MSLWTTFLEMWQAEMPSLQFVDVKTVVKYGRTLESDWNEAILEDRRREVAKALQHRGKSVLVGYTPVDGMCGADVETVWRMNGWIPESERKRILQRSRETVQLHTEGTVRRIRP